MSQELNRRQMLAAMAVSASGLGGVAKGLPPDSAKLATFVLGVPSK